MTHQFASLLRRASWARRLAALLTLAMVFPPIGALLSPAQAQAAPSPASTTPGGIRSILLFPAAQAANAGGASASVTSRLDDAIKLRLDLIGTYTAMTFTKFLPAVQRSLNEADSTSGLTDADIQVPFGKTDLARAQKIATTVGTDAFLLTTVISNSQDTDSRRITMLVNSQLYDTQTGQPLPGLGGSFSGAAAPTTPSDTDAQIQQAAINDVAGRIVSSLRAAGSHSQAVVETSSQRGSSRGAQTAIAVLLVGALAYAILNGAHISSGGGGGSSSSSSSSSGGTGSGGTGSGGTGSGGSSGPPAPPSTHASRR